MPLDTHYPLWMQAAPSGGGEPVPDPVAAELRASLAAHLGRAVVETTPPVLCDDSYGPGAVELSITSPDVDPAWGGRLVLRGRGAVAEAAVLAAAADLPCGVPRLVASAVPVPADLGGRAVVFEVPPGRDFVDVIGDDPDGAGDRLRGLAREHAAVHAVPTSVVDGVPALDLDAELASFPAGLESQRAWLDANRPAPGPAVLCHGGLSPLVVRIDPASARPVVRNWSAAVLAEREHDLAWTLLSFWIAPFFAATRSERRGMTMIRDGLANLYRTSYEAVAPAERERLRYWQAFHCARGAAEAALRPGALPEEVGPNLLKRFTKLSKR